MFLKRKPFLVLIALLLTSSNQSWAHGGGGGGGHMGGGGFGGHSMSFGHSMGSFHPSSFSSSGHMYGFPSNFGVGHSFGHIEGAHADPMWSPYFSHEAEMSAPASHGFGHGLGRFFGFHSTPHVPAASTPLEPGLNRVISPGSPAIAINPGT